MNPCSNPCRRHLVVLALTFGLATASGCGSSQPAKARTSSTSAKTSAPAKKANAVPAATTTAVSGSGFTTVAATTTVATKTAAAAGPATPRATASWMRTVNYTYDVGGGNRFLKIVAYNGGRKEPCKVTVEFHFFAKTTEVRHFQAWTEFPGARAVRTRMFSNNVAGHRRFFQTFNTKKCWGATASKPGRIHVTSCVTRGCTPSRAGDFGQQAQPVNPGGPIARPPSISPVAPQKITDWVDVACLNDAKALYGYATTDAVILRWLKLCRTGGYGTSKCTAATEEPGTKCNAAATKMYSYRMNAAVQQSFANACKTRRCMMTLGKRSRRSEVNTTCIQNQAKAYRYAPTASVVAGWLKQCRKTVSDKTCELTNTIHNSACVKLSKKVSHYKLSEQDITTFVGACRSYHYQCR